MKPKPIIIGCVIFLSFFLSGNSWAQDRYGYRPNRQPEKIHKNIKHGNITLKEFDYLHKEQRHIRKARKKAHADGHLSYQEKRRLANMRHQADQHINRPSHNQYNRRPHPHVKYKSNHHSYGKEHRRHYPCCRKHKHFASRPGGSRLSQRHPDFIWGLYFSSKIH